MNDWFLEVSPEGLWQVISIRCRKCPLVLPKMFVQFCDLDDIGIRF